MTQPENGTTPGGAGRQVIRKLLITGAFGGGAYLVTNLTHQPQVWVLTMSIFIGGVALVTQFLIDLEVRLAALDERQVRQADRMRKMVGRRFSDISTATELFADMEAGNLRTDTIVELVQHAVRIRRSGGGLVLRLAEARLRNTARFLQDIVDNARTEIPGSENEQLFELVKNTTTSMKATSSIGVDGRGLVDEVWWHSAEADQYIALQRDAVERGVDVRRIFIADLPDPTHPESQALVEEFQRLVESNIEVGIKVRILKKVPVGERGASIDFVLFEDEVSYEFSYAPPQADQRRPTIQSTQLEMRVERVQARTTQFDRLWNARESIDPA